METLKEFAELCLSVEERVGSLDDHVTNSDASHKLGWDISLLRNVAPRLDVLYEVTFKWLMHGLKSLETHYVVEVEHDTHGWEKVNLTGLVAPQGNDNILLGTRALGAFCNRRCLGKYFPQVYERVRELYQRLVNATKEDTKHGSGFRKVLSGWEKMLVQGDFG